MSTISLLATPSITNFNLTRYNIFSAGKLRSRPYQIVFQRVQVVGGKMNSWNAGPGKRPPDSEPGPSKPSPAKRIISGPGPSGSQSVDEDQVMARLHT